MSVEQLEAAIEAMPVRERRKLVRWLDQHRAELLGETRGDTEAAQAAEVLLRRQEYDEHPERFTRMSGKALDRMFSRVRKNVAARLSSARRG